MKVRFLHLSRVRISALFLFIAFFLYQNSIFAGAHRLENTLFAQEITLIEAIHNISEQYQVLFNYDRKIVSDITVQYEPKEFENVDAAIASVLKETNLKYQIFSHRYVVIYKNDEEGIESLKEMIQHFQTIVDDREDIVLERQRLKPSPKLIRTLPQDVLSDRTIAYSIEGTVTDQDGEPLIGVNIQVKGTNMGTSTDIDGMFAIDDIDENAVLVVSYIGYQTQEVAVAGKSNLTIVLLSDSQLLDEVVVVGYGTQKKTTLTGSVSVIEGEEIANITVPNISGSIAGRMTGVIMKSNTGQPGNDSPDIYIRGISSIGSNAPLVVVDGIIRDNINQIDPSSIESISILKDASAVAPYGLAGANGVILISTKKGEEGSPTLTFNSYFGVQSPTYFPDLLDAKDYMRLQNEAYLNEQPGGQNLPYSVDMISNYDNLNKEDPDKYPNSRTQDFVNDSAPIQKYNIQISGGTEKSRYYAGLSYFQQDGLFERTNYNRYNYNLNLEMDVTNSTTFLISFLGSLEQTNDLDPQASSTRLFRGLFKYFPTEPLYYTNGLWGASAGNSPIGLLNSNSYQNDNENTLLGTISLEQEIKQIRGLSVKGSFSYDNRSIYEKGWHVPWRYWTQNTSSAPYLYTETTAGLEGHASYTFLSEEYNKNNYFTYQGIINYNRDIGNSSFSGLIVAEARNNYYNRFTAQRNNFAVNVDELDLGSSNKTDFNNGGSSSEGAQMGYVYRLGYVFDNKYIFEAAGRYDGHYYFAPDNRWGYFPSFSLGWRLSEEKFLENSKYIDDLKIRGSWGKSGNLAGSPYQYLSGYTLAGNAYGFGSGTMVQGAFNSQESNPLITWEIAEKIDLGFDFSMSNGLFNFEGDYFYEKRKDMLIAPQVSVPYEYGLSLSQENAAEMVSHGFEITMGFRKTITKNVQVNVGANVSLAKNKMTEIFETDATYNNTNRRRTGRPYQTPFGYQSLGLFKSTDDINSDGIINEEDGYSIKQFGALHPGDIKYKDISGPEGVPDGVIDSHDETVIGFPDYPSLTFGISPTLMWKGFDVGLFFQGASLVSRDIGTFQTVAFANNKSNSTYEYFYNHWTIDNEDASYPRANTSPSSNNTQISDFWMLNTSYVRLKTGMIGYNIPTKVCQVLKLQNIRVYISGQNIWTLSNLKFEDPETSAYGSRESVSYPNMKSYAFGLSVTF